MLKKKNIAMVMAAATVATSVAPVFAAEVVEKTVSTDSEISALASKVDELLAKKYTNEEINGYDDKVIPEHFKTVSKTVQNSVYEITAKVDGKDDKAVTSGAELLAIIEQAKVDGKDVTVDFKDKGSETVDGKIVDQKSSYNRAVDKEYLKTLTVEGALSTMKTAKVIEENAKLDDAENPTKASIKLVGGKEITLELNDLQLDFTKPLDANKNAVVVDEDSDLSVKKSVSGFAVKKETTEATFNFADKKVASVKVEASATKITEYKVADLFTGRDLTQKGNDLAKLVKNGVTNKKAGVDKVQIGDRYYIANELEEGKSVGTITHKDGMYQVEITLNVKDASSDKAGQVEKYIIKGENQSDLNTLVTALKAGFHNSNIKTVAGSDRFETAIEVSKEYTNTDTVNSKAIVLVGRDAVVDGLAVAPLAQKLNAPILLTDKDVVPSNVMKEIDRVIKEEVTDGGVKTIYLVGGENTISDSVKSQLAKYGITIKRLAGDSRYQTSVKIAEELYANEGVKTGAYIVGGYGEADAMSIAPKAAAEGKAIIVSDVDAKDKDVRAFLKANKDAIVSLEIIGGQTHISTDAMKELKEMATSTILRTAGANRQETNAKVVAGFESNTTDFVLSKDGSGNKTELVDALASAPLAAQLKAPIVLNTNGLTTAQVNAVDKVAQKDGTAKIFQVGQGIASDVMSKMIETLKLK